MYVKNIGKIIEYERKCWGMSRRRLAALAHTNTEIIEDLESGHLENPDFFLLLEICEVLQISIFDYIDPSKKR